MDSPALSLNTRQGRMAMLPSRDGFGVRLSSLIDLEWIYHSDKEFSPESSDYNEEDDVDPRHPSERDEVLRNWTTEGILLHDLIGEFDLLGPKIKPKYPKRKIKSVCGDRQRNATFAHFLAEEKEDRVEAWKKYHREFHKNEKDFFEAYPKMRGACITSAVKINTVKKKSIREEELQYFIQTEKVHLNIDAQDVLENKPFHEVTSTPGLDDYLRQLAKKERRNWEIKMKVKMNWNFIKYKP